MKLLWVFFSVFTITLAAAEEERDLSHEELGTVYKHVAHALRTHGLPEAAESAEMEWAQLQTQDENSRRRLVAKSSRGGKNAACAGAKSPSSCIKGFNKLVNNLIQHQSNAAKEVCQKPSNKRQRSAANCCGKTQILFGCLGGGVMNCCGATQASDGWCYADHGHYRTIQGSNVCPPDKWTCSRWGVVPGDLCADSTQTCFGEIVDAWTAVADVVVNMMSMVLLGPGAKAGKAAVMAGKNALISAGKGTFRKTMMLAIKKTVSHAGRDIMWNNLKRNVKKHFKKVPRRVGKYLMEESMAITSASEAKEQSSGSSIAVNIAEIVDPTGIVTFMKYLYQERQQCKYPEGPSSREIASVLQMIGQSCTVPDKYKPDWGKNRSPSSNCEEWWGNKDWGAKENCDACARGRWGREQCATKCCSECGVEDPCSAGATHQELGGRGARDVATVAYSGSTDAERDRSCCAACSARSDCEYWVRATNSRHCWLKSNGGNPITSTKSSVRRGGMRALEISLAEEEEDTQEIEESECDQLKCPSSSTTCVMEDDNAVCKCTDPQLIYDPETHQCVEKNTYHFTYDFEVKVCGQVHIPDLATCAQAENNAAPSRGINLGPCPQNYMKCPDNSEVKGYVDNSKVQVNKYVKSCTDVAVEFKCIPTAGGANRNMESPEATDAQAIVAPEAQDAQANVAPEANVVPGAAKLSIVDIPDGAKAPLEVIDIPKSEIEVGQGNVTGISNDTVMKTGAFLMIAILFASFWFCGFSSKKSHYIALMEETADEI